jgi:DNA-binding XRE family transcriptional regulator
MGAPGKPERNEVERSPFGTELYRLRHAAGFTQAELARRAGLNRRTVEWSEREGTHGPLPATIAALERGLDQPGALRVGPCVVCDGPAPVGRRWCDECAPDVARIGRAP